MNTPLLSDLTGKVIGEYTLHERLGAGGMGVVYRAFQNNLQRGVAIKLLPPSLATQQNYGQRFIQEARTAASLEHAHIVPVYDYGTEDGLSYVVMRILTGGTLSERMQVYESVPPSLGEITGFLNQIGGALDYAHGKGVVHRDIKANNIMFDDQGSAFLVDFGIAKLLNEAGITNSGMSMGTPAYMSPEQWRGEKVTPASDQYSLGVVVYELIAGHHPFETESVVALLNKHLNERPTPLTEVRSDIPEAINPVLERVLAKDPELRYESIGDFAAAFEDATRGSHGQSTGLFTFALKNNTPEHVPDVVDMVPMDSGTPLQDQIWVWQNTATRQATPQELEYVKRSVENRIKRARAVMAFMSNLVSWIVINIIVFAMYGLQLWHSILIVGWGIGVVIHGVATFYDSDRRQKVYQREFAHALEQQGYDPSIADHVKIDVTDH